MLFTERMYSFMYISTLNTSIFLLTHSAAPSSSPENVQISEVTATSFLLSWSAPADVDQNGLIRSYTLNVTELNTETWRLLTTSSNSQRLQSLHPYYNYTCVVSAVTVEAGPYSLPVTITTAESGESDIECTSPGGGGGGCQQAGPFSLPVTITTAESGESDIECTSPWVGVSRLVLTHCL